jgi:hypothetical protein
LRDGRTVTLEPLAVERSLLAGRLLRYAGKRRERYKGHASPGHLAFSAVGVQVMFVAGGTDRRSIDLLGGDTSGS